MQRFWCVQGHAFSVDHRRKRPLLWIAHMDGVPIRKLADEHGRSPTQIFRQLNNELEQLPDSNMVTADYCNRFCGILIVDAKYVKVRGFQKKIAFVYGIDYLTHDIVVSLLTPSENHHAYLQFFHVLHRASYGLQIVVADDHGAIQEALVRVFPQSLLQRCHNHYLENIRQLLRIRTEGEHQLFFYALKKKVFDQYENRTKLDQSLHDLFGTFATHDVVRQQILREIAERKEELFAYPLVPRCPPNTNLIELFNSHFNGRLKTIKGFKSFANAKRWLNAAVLRRRTKPFTDCEGQFKQLNHHCSLEFTIKKQAPWPDILGAPDPRKTHPK